MLQEIIRKFKDPEMGKKILNSLIPKLERVNDKLGRKLSLMEVCGTHTVSISETGIRDLLFSHTELKSGPGCPVCVTDQEDIDYMLKLAEQKDIVIATFGDMMRVPGSRKSLIEQKAEGADIRLIYSAAGAVNIAKNNPQKQVVLLGIGFETTVPTIAASLQMAESKRIENFYLFSVHKVVPPALRVLLEDPEVKVDGFILPGHVSVIIGRQAWDFLVEDYSCPSAVAGFEAIDILLGLDSIADQILGNKAEVTNMYPRVVREEGNIIARRLIDRYFVPDDSSWRGIGVIPGSGLELKDTFSFFDAKNKFDVRVSPSKVPAGCACGDVLKGKILPYECPLFGSICKPVSPVGPCMVSSEGACAAYYSYHIDPNKVGAVDE